MQQPLKVALDHADTEKARAKPGQGIIMKLKTYSVRVTVGKNGTLVGTFEVKAAKPDEARKRAIVASAAHMMDGDTDGLYAHAPARVGDKYSSR